MGGDDLLGVLVGVSELNSDVVVQRQRPQRAATLPYDFTAPLS